MANAEQWAAAIAGPAYAIDDETAIKVVDGTVEVVSEGHWRSFPRSRAGHSVAGAGFRSSTASARLSCFIGGHEEQDDRLAREGLSDTDADFRGVDV